MVQESIIHQYYIISSSLSSPLIHLTHVIQGSIHVFPPILTPHSLRGTTPSLLSTLMTPTVNLFPVSSHLRRTLSRACEILLLLIRFGNRFETKSGPNFVVTFLQLQYLAWLLYWSSSQFEVPWVLPFMRSSLCQNPWSGWAHWEGIQPSSHTHEDNTAYECGLNPLCVCLRPRHSSCSNILSSCSLFDFVVPHAATAHHSSLPASVLMSHCQSP